MQGTNVKIIDSVKWLCAFRAQPSLQQLSQHSNKFQLHAVTQRKIIGAK